MSASASYLNGNAVRVFALFAGLAFVSGLLATYLNHWIGASRRELVSGLSDIVRFGGPVVGFAAAILISSCLGWLAVHGTPVQYLKAALAMGIAMPAAALAYIALGVVISFTLGRLIPSMTNDHPLYVAGAYVTFALAGAVFPLLTSYALRTLTGIWDWWLVGGIYVVMWPAVLAPSPWDRPFVSVIGGLIGLWLSRAPPAS